LRVGFGYDIHRLVAGRPMRVGCVELPSDRGPLGHSDGDVAAHAACDALLSAAGLGDIGERFPPGDPLWAGAAGALLLTSTRALLESNAARPVQVDVTVVAEEPRIAPHRGRMRQAMAEALGLDPSVVSIKGRSHEGLGAIGRGEAIAAYAVVLVELSAS
jgi:2-C-methyl-D-erythritol 2,4-cyclodiphosphate synthase